MDYLNANYKGAVMNVSHGGTCSQDFYSDKLQTYLTTSIGGTSSWIGANTSYKSWKRWLYDMSYFKY